MYSRQDYLQNKCSHRQYYAQFVDDSVRRMVEQYFTLETLRASTDEHLNDIPLRRWDSLAIMLVHYSSIRELLREYGDFWSLAGGVCILKEAAHQLVEGKKLE